MNNGYTRFKRCPNFRQHLQRHILTCLWQDFHCNKWTGFILEFFSLLHIRPMAILECIYYLKHAFSSSLCLFVSTCKASNWGVGHMILHSSHMVGWRFTFLQHTNTLNYSPNCPYRHLEFRLYIFWSYWKIYQSFFLINYKQLIVIY